MLASDVTFPSKRSFRRVYSRNAADASSRRESSLVSFPRAKFRQVLLRYDVSACYTYTYAPSLSKRIVQFVRILEVSRRYVSRVAYTRCIEKRASILRYQMTFFPDDSPFTISAKRCKYFNKRYDDSYSTEIFMMLSLHMFPDRIIEWNDAIKTF